MKIAIVCGGPSLERGISLNSARSVVDHLLAPDLEIIPVYLDPNKNAYKISTAQLYSNTPSDFDFKLSQTALPMADNALIKFLQSVDIVFPVMHGPFGEDGGIQRFLEKHKIPFIGSGSEACRNAFDKFCANEFIKARGFFTLPSALLKIYHTDHRAIVERFFKAHHIKRAIVKPANGGSSIGVFSVSTPDEALEKVKLIFSKRMDSRVVIEQFAEGTEFTTVILENRFGLPVALPPTEIETDYTKHQIFDFRKKYLPTRQVIWHCPPRFNDAVIEKIQIQAEQLFAALGMRDFGRFDGWVLPDNTLWFSDFNPISGMEQNSFLFQQASRIGMTHANVLRHIVKNASKRYNLPFSEEMSAIDSRLPRKKVSILFGGATSERQVSLMSGTNVWLKLRNSKKYVPQPFLLSAHGDIWRLPYSLALNHTVEEIAENCKNYLAAKQRLNVFEERARVRLGLLESKDDGEFFEPQKMPMSILLKNSEFIFNALHGGDGENGVLQSTLEKNKILFNGSDESVSQLCMNKWKTSNFIEALHLKGVRAIPGKIIGIDTLQKAHGSDLRKLWKSIRREVGGTTIIVKPLSDGCSTGVAHLYSSVDLENYITLTTKRVLFAPKEAFRNQTEAIEMPLELPKELLFERFMDTDVLRIKGGKLKHQRKTGWMEITIGVIEVGGSLRAFNPSITIAEGEVLTVEEKFQGGTGVNITPPPVSIIKSHVLTKIKMRIQMIASKIGITGYCRIDAFVNIYTGDLNIIEINTLPALTASTVFYQQALVENPAIYPRNLIEMLIENKGY